MNGSPRRVLIVLALAGLAAGCGRGSAGAVHGAAVKGRLLEHGKPMKFLPNEQVQVTFVAEGKDATASIADVNPEDGTFEISGPSGEGIPPGRYKVGLASAIYGGEGGNRFERTFNAQVTPLAADVGAEDGQTFDVDVGEKRVTRK